MIMVVNGATGFHDLLMDHGSMVAHEQWSLEAPLWSIDQGPMVMVA